MFPTHGSRSRGFDLVLLGTLVAGLGLYARVLSGSTEASPSLLRFFQVPADTRFPAVLPQDKALLLLTDPRTADAAAGGVDPTGGIGVVLLAIGVVLVSMGLLTVRSS